MAWYQKYYRCICGHEWQDEWDYLCNDRCPTCDTECEPYNHAEVDLHSQDKAYQDAIMYGTGVVKNYPLQSHSIPFIMLIRKDHPNEKLDLDALIADGTIVPCRDPET